MSLKLHPSTHQKRAAWRENRQNKQKNFLLFRRRRVKLRYPIDDGNRTKKKAKKKHTFAKTNRKCRSFLKISLFTTRIVYASPSSYGRENFLRRADGNNASILPQFIKGTSKTFHPFSTTTINCRRCSLAYIETYGVARRDVLFFFFAFFIVSLG